MRANLMAYCKAVSRSSPSAGAATGLIHFRAVVQEAFSDTYLPNTPNVSEGDSLTNHVTIEGTIRDNNDVAIVLGHRTGHEPGKLDCRGRFADQVGVRH